MLPCVKNALYMVLAQEICILKRDEGIFFYCLSSPVLWVVWYLSCQWKSLGTWSCSQGSADLEHLPRPLTPRFSNVFAVLASEVLRWEAAVLQLTCVHAEGALPERVPAFIWRFLARLLAGPGILWFSLALALPSITAWAQPSCMFLLLI